MSHNGWRVKTIEPQTVEFERNGEVQSINIELANEPVDKGRKPGVRLPVNRRNQQQVPPKK
jgi:hypothetical protein